MNSFKKLSIIFFTLALVFFNNPVFAQTETQEQMEAELKEIERQIQEFSAELQKTQTQKKTLSNKIKQLQIQQKALSLQIKETSLKITSLDKQISVMEKNIKANLIKERNLSEDIAYTLRRMNSVDNNFIIALLTADGFSNFVNEIQEYSQLSGSLKSLQTKAKNVRIKLTEEQEKLEGQKEESQSLLNIKSIQQGKLNGTIDEQSELLTVTKGVESNYQNILTDKKKRAAELRNRIYELFNTGKQITFGEAVTIAKWAGELTGMRPAFLLAVLTQESNLGKNVGTCNRVGDPEEKGWKVIMKPTRDHEPFLTITKELGLDPDITPVSCPMKDKYGKQFGWGGAMGPAQFIPSTWMGYRSKIAALTGKPANPWDIRDAFLATAIKTKADGANGTYDGEWKAAMKYFAGSVNLKYRFYGDNVMALTKQYLEEIDEL